MERTRLALALVGLLAGVGAAWIMLGNEVRHASAADVALLLAVGWSFLASGLVAWRLRPDNPIGPAMVATGLLRFAEAPFWSQDPVVFTIGHVFSYLVPGRDRLRPARVPDRSTRDASAARPVLGSRPWLPVRFRSPGCWWEATSSRGPARIARSTSSSSRRRPISRPRSRSARSRVGRDRAVRSRSPCSCSAGSLQARRFVSRSPRSSGPAPRRLAALVLTAPELRDRRTPWPGPGPSSSTSTLALMAVAFLLGVARTRLARSAVADL